MFTGPSSFRGMPGMQRTRYESVDRESVVEYRRVFLPVVSRKSTRTLRALPRFPCPIDDAH